MMCRLSSGLICLLPLFVLEAYADSNQETNEVTVIGQRSEINRVNRGGATIVLRPQSSSANDLSLFLASDPTISGIEGGFYSFRVPLFRGQDSKETSLYLSGVSLFDPLTSMPLLEDIELRMFDQVTIHKGLTPWDLPGADRGGVLDFAFDSKVKLNEKSKKSVSKEEIGTEAGSETLTKLWAKSGVANSNSTQSFFASRKSWVGDYLYFDDQGTVLNSQDDQTVRMKGNSGQSSQFSGYLSHTEMARSFEVFIATFVRESGYPDVSNRAESQRRVESETSLFLFKSTFVLSPIFELGGSFSGLESNKSFQERVAKAAPVQNERSSAARTGSLFAKARFDHLRVMTQWTAVKSDVSFRSGDGSVYLSPMSQDFSSGILVDLNDFMMESKSEFIWDHKEVLKRNLGLSLSYAVGPSLVWSQFVSQNRKASLLETYGDGGTIEPSKELKQESLLGVELGVRWNMSDSSSSSFKKMSHQLVLWNDKRSNPIEILQVSRSKWRALNLDYTKTFGGEIRSGFAWRKLELELGGSQVRSMDSKDKISHRLPIWQGVLSPKYHISKKQHGMTNQHSVVLSSLIRHQGPQFSDAMNLVKLSPITTIDLTLDWANFRMNDETREVTDKWKGSVSILNASNVIYESFVVEDGLRSSGRMTRYGQGQSPLPGRQWVVRLERAF